MKTLQSTVFTIAALLTATSLLADDRLVSVKSESGQLTVVENGSQRLLQTKFYTRITINGVPAALDQLVPGMNLRLAYSDAMTVAKVDAQGLPNQTPATPPPAKPSSPLGSQPFPVHKLTIKMRVDGADTVRIYNGQLWLEHGNYNKPDQIFLNGVAWSPVWHDQISEPFAAFDPPLAPFGMARPTIQQIAGRERVTLQKPPPTKYEYIPAVVFSDPQPGSDTYEIILSW